MPSTVSQISTPQTHFSVAVPEWATPDVVFLGWPTRQDVWRSDCSENLGRVRPAGPARAAMAALARTASKYVKVCILSTPDNGAYEDASKEFAADAPRIMVHCVQMDDCWIRDTGPVFTKQHSLTLQGHVPAPSTLAVSFEFNAWGGNVDGCYNNYERDRSVGRSIADVCGLECLRSDMVLEGGSISCDGRGTVITTMECLLDGYRNPGSDKKTIECRLGETIGARKVIWLPFGAARDTDTNGHVDNMCLFVAPATVLLHWSEMQDDPEQYSRSVAALQVLKCSVDAEGNQFKIYKLHAPRLPVIRTDEEAAGVLREPCETGVDSFTKKRLSGERVAASYVNLLILQNVIIVPQFLVNADDDARALHEVREAVKEASVSVVGVPAREFVLGGGGIHCLSLSKPAS